MMTVKYIMMTQLQFFLTFKLSYRNHTKNEDELFAEKGPQF